MHGLRGRHQPNARRVPMVGQRSDAWQLGGERSGRRQAPSRLPCIMADWKVISLEADLPALAVALLPVRLESGLVWDQILGHLQQAVMHAAVLTAAPTPGRQRPSIWRVAGGQLETGRRASDRAVATFGRHHASSITARSPPTRSNHPSNLKRLPTVSSSSSTRCAYKLVVPIELWPAASRASTMLRPL